MSEPQPDDLPILQGFFTWFNNSKSPGTRSSATETTRGFIPIRRVEAYFEDLGRLTNILRVVYDSVDLPVQPELIRRKYPRTFCILLLIGKGKYIRHFTEFGSLGDQRLPFVSKPKDFPSATVGPDFFTSFYQYQWTFCPQVFSYDEINVQLEKEHILPIIYKEKLAGGGSAIIYKIILHESYNRLNPTGAEPDPGNRLANTFVLKTYYTKNAENYYHNEVDAFSRLRSNRKPNPNVIGFYGSYIQDGSFNVLLEFADKGNLEQFFAMNEPPSSSEDIIGFWGGMFKAIRALVKIHEVKPSHTTGPEIFQGWHQDVKPSNILVTSGNKESPYEWQFKLADLGLSHFKDNLSSEEGSVDRDTHGTRTYGAPECYRSDDFIANSRLEVKQNVDIWSLGCIYSEAAVWVVHGYKAVQQYRRERRLATEQISGFRDGDCFHDGENMLATVREWHEKLPRNVRHSDFITVRVLEKIINEMLDDSESRLNAKQLWRKSQRILQDAVVTLEANNTSDGPTASLLQSRESHQIPPQPPWGPQTAPSPPPSFIVHGHGASSSLGDSRELPGILYDQSQRQSPENSIVEENCPAPFSTISSGRIISQYHARHASLLRSNQLLETENRSNERRQTQRQPEGQSGQDLIARQHTKHETIGQSGHDLQSQGRSNTFRNSLTPQDQPREPPPILSVRSAKEWKERRKRTGDKSVQPRDAYLLGRLNNRDHVFLIDDAASMMPHWLELKILFGVLAYMVKESDPDGVELIFTSSLERERSGRTTRLLQMLEKKVPAGLTDINISLGFVLQEYLEKLQTQPTSKPLFKSRSVRPLNIYIFTDGKWQPECDAETPIRDLVKGLQDLQRLDKQKQVGVQFIRFGNDETGFARLERLDSGLGLDMDIVDTTPSNGNVWKMLLGAIDKWFDGDPITNIAISRGFTSPSNASAG